MTGIQRVPRIRRYRRRRQPRLAGKVNQLVRRVNFLSLHTDAENATHLISSGGTNITNTGTIVCLNQIAQGDDNIHRQGCDILARYLAGVICMKETVDKQHLIKVMVFVDKDNQGTDPAVTTVLQTASPLAFINIDQSERFSILFHKIYTLSGGDNNLQAFCRKIYIRLNFKMYYDGTASTNYGTNALYLLFISDQATEYPTMIYDLRLAFTE